MYQLLRWKHIPKHLEENKYSDLSNTPNSLYDNQVAFDIEHNGKNGNCLNRLLYKSNAFIQSSVCMLELTAFLVIFAIGITIIHAVSIIYLVSCSQFLLANPINFWFSLITGSISLLVILTTLIQKKQNYLVPVICAALLIGCNILLYTSVNRNYIDFVNGLNVIYTDQGASMKDDVNGYEDHGKIQKAGRPEYIGPDQRRETTEHYIGNDIDINNKLGEKNLAIENVEFIAGDRNLENSSKVSKAPLHTAKPIENAGDEIPQTIGGVDGSEIIQTLPIQVEGRPKVLQNRHAKPKIDKNAPDFIQPRGKLLQIQRNPRILGPGVIQNSKATIHTPDYVEISNKPLQVQCIPGILGPEVIQNPDNIMDTPDYIEISNKPLQVQCIPDILGPGITQNQKTNMNTPDSAITRTKQSKVFSVLSN